MRQKSCSKSERANRHLKTEEEEEQTYRKKSWGKTEKEILHRLVDGQNSWRRSKEVPERGGERGESGGTEPDL